MRIASSGGIKVAKLRNIDGGKTSSSIDLTQNESSLWRTFQSFSKDYDSEPGLGYNIITRENEKFDDWLPLEFSEIISYLPVPLPERVTVLRDTMMKST